MRACLLFLMLWGCGAPAPAATGVMPASVRSGGQTALVVNGSGFEPSLSVDFDNPTQTSVNEQLSVALIGNGANISLAPVVWVNDQQLQATLPSKLPVGVFSLVVTRPDGQSAVMPSALTVTP